MAHIPQSGGPQAPYGMYVAQGYYNNLTGIHKYGFNADIDTTFEVVWEQGGTLTLPTTAAVASINSASGNSGVVITVEGLDGDYNEITDTITLDGSGDGSTTETFLRVNRAFVSGATALSADADITIGANTVAHIDSDHQQTLQMIYTVPAGKNAYLVQMTGGVSEKEKNVEMRIRGKESGGVFRTRDYVAFQTSFFHKGYQIPVHFGEKCDILVDAKCVGNASISASFDMILEDQ